MLLHCVRGAFPAAFMGLLLSVCCFPLGAAETSAPAAAGNPVSLPLLIEKDGETYQVLQVSLDAGEALRQATVRATGARPFHTPLVAGPQTIDVLVPATEVTRTVRVSVRAKGRTLVREDIVVRPTRRWTMYILPHSHVDIGYTKLQSEVEAQQHGHLERAVELAAQTANYPDGARFKWNTEVVWAVDSYLETAPPEKRAAFLASVKSGAIEVNALYGNELTALCKSEELVYLLRRATQLRREFGLPIETAMISDVPGYTWGLAPVLAGNGVRYFSMGPNRGDRIGFTLEDWGDKPFYWTSPSGNAKVLCWMAGEGYSLFHRGPLRDGGVILKYVAQLESKNYPYDMVQVRYSTGGDNGPPDPGLCDFVRDWNAKYASPRLVVATAAEMFRAFESKYAEKIPSASGDFTPYWEDGAASSARETSFNRAAAERLAQAGTLWTMLDPAHYPARGFERAWRNVVLYDEHTWGAHNSISAPDSEFARGQWRIKQAFANDGYAQSLALMKGATGRFDGSGVPVRSVMVFNTCSWTRTDLVVVSGGKKFAGTRVTNSAGNAVPSQLLSTGELAFVATNVPAFGSRRFDIGSGTPARAGSAHAQDNTLENDSLRLEVNPRTGAIAVLQTKKDNMNWVDQSGGMGLNEYFYVQGKDPKNALRIDSATLRIGESGPLIASLVIESAAPGCYGLERELRLTYGLERLDIRDVLYKKAVRDKEGVHIAFPFNVPDGVVRIDSPWAVVRAETDQLSGSCKNWFTVQRWVDISNRDRGITWATVDAPLVELGAITAELPWIRTLPPTQTIYSYVMNNYWHTNYKADQDGPTLFRYSLRPHGAHNESAAQRFGLETSQPLIVVPVSRSAKEVCLPLRIGPDDVIASALYPEPGKGVWVLRLFAASDQPQQASIQWLEANKPEMYLSDLTGSRGGPIRGPVDIPPHGIVTIAIVCADTRQP